jgi:ribonuclease HII
MPSLKKQSKNKPSLEFEISRGYPRIAMIGIDEVGRGCLAGPVVTAAVVFPESLENIKSWPAWLHRVRDSKLVPEKERGVLAHEIKNFCSFYALGEASVDEIDQLNILHAAELAMVRAAQALKVKNTTNQLFHILVDGHRIPKNLPYEASCLIGGDRLSLTIAAASLLAKVYRDELMVKYSKIYPGYGFEKNKGYGTALHLKGLSHQGVTPIHRKSFAPVQKNSGRLFIPA